MKNVLIIGCGEIGSSLIEGWLSKKKEFYKKINHIYVLEKNLKRKKFLQKNFKNKISFVNLDNIKKEFRYIFWYNFKFITIFFYYLILSNSFHYWITIKFFIKFFNKIFIFKFY